jgi:surface protein
MEALVLFNKTLYSEIFKDGKVTILEILDGIKKFSYHGTIDNNNTVHHYNLDVDYSQTSYSDIRNTITKFDVFVKKNDYSLTVTANNIAKNRDHLIELIKKEVAIHGWQCDLNHIDVSHVTHMNSLFSVSNKLNDFNGDISQWNTSNVTNMCEMFCNSQFTGDISKWNTSNVEIMTDLFNGYKHTIDISQWNVSNVHSMYQMFANSDFNGDVSKWDVSNVEDMHYMFAGSKFTGDLSIWKPYKTEDIDEIFDRCEAQIPYWANYSDLYDRKKAIDSYWLHNELNNKLNDNYDSKPSTQKIKI